MPEVTSLARPSPTTWVITLSNAPENRLSFEVLQRVLGHLDEIEAQWRTDGSKDGGAVVITSSIPKFWSNGFVVANLTRPGFGELLPQPLMWRLLTCPLITIAAIYGHCFAGGCLMALCCDYRLMSSGKGWISMNELLIRVPITSGTGAVLTQRIPKHAWRDTIMGKRWTSTEAKEAGIVDEVVDTSSDQGAVLKRGLELAGELAPRVASGSWGSIKDGIYQDIKRRQMSRRFSYYPDQEAVALEDRMAKDKASL